MTEKRPGTYMYFCEKPLPPPAPMPPIPFRVLNKDYPDNVKTLVDIARKSFKGEIHLLMSEKTKAVADATGDSEIMEKATGLKILTIDCPYGAVMVGQLDTENHPVLFPAAVVVDYEADSNCGFIPCKED